MRRLTLLLPLRATLLLRRPTLPMLRAMRLLRLATRRLMPPLLRVTRLPTPLAPLLTLLTPLSMRPRKPLLRRSKRLLQVGLNGRAAGAENP